MKIFRKFRVDSLINGDFKKYLKYAIGEIVLVTVGILIAFQINNYKEKRNAHQKLIDIIKIVKEELKNDTAEVNRAIAVYTERNTLFDNIFNGSVSLKELDSVEGYRHLIFSYYPVNIDQTGYNLLKQYESALRLSNDTAILETIQFYNFHLKWFENAQELLQSDINKNLQFYSSTYPWFYKRMLNKPSPFGKHIKSDPFFMNRAVYHYALYSKNYLPYLEHFEIQSAEILSKLEEIK